MDHDKKIEAPSNTKKNLETESETKPVKIRSEKQTQDKNRRRSYFHSREQAFKYQKLKFNLCNAIKDISFNKYKNTAQVAMIAGTNQNRMNEVYKLQLDKLTVNQLVRYLIRIEPRIQFIIVHKHFGAELPQEHYPDWGI